MYVMGNTSHCANNGTPITRQEYVAQKCTIDANELKSVVIDVSFSQNPWLNLCHFVAVSNAMTPLIKPPTEKAIHTKFIKERQYSLIYHP